MASQALLFHIRDQRRQGWFSVDNEIVDNYASQIGAYGVAVYCVLCRHVRNENQQVKLSARDIGAALGISHDRVRKSLTDLVGVDLIHHEVPERSGPGLISTITLLDAKTTGRHTSSSVGELDATRPRNKEVKTKTETKTPPPLFEESAFVLKENARARETTEVSTVPMGGKTYGHEDFDARDLRKLADARKEVHLQLANGWGSNLTNDEILAHQCALAGVSVKRAREVWARAETQSELEASA